LILIFDFFLVYQIIGILIQIHKSINAVLLISFVYGNRNASYTTMPPAQVIGNSLPVVT